MNDLALKPATQQIVVDEIFPHDPAIIWKTLTNGALMARWLMEPKGFAAVEGTHFTFQTTPAGAWDGTIHCQVLEVRPNERLSYAWKGGDDGNVGYGSRLDTVLSFDLEKTENGTRVRLVHSGFELPRNELTMKNMSEGWKIVLPRLREATGTTH